ncbi:MAG TPA: hypothetical protein VGN61_01880 [Verrucomicrobiae bacterium]
MNDWNDSGTLSEHEALIARYLRDSRKREALTWLKGGTGVKRLIGESKTKRESLALVKGLYAMGAEKVIAVYIRSTKQAKGQRTGRLVVKLPAGAAQRRAIFDWCNAQGDSLGYTPKPDHGETYMFLLLE